VIKSVDIVFPSKERPNSVKNLLDSLSLYNKRETIRHNVYFVGDCPERDVDKAYKRLERDYHHKNGLGDVVYIRHDSRGTPLADLWNEAVKLGSSDYVWIFNDDCEATNYWVDRVPESFETDGKIGALAPRIAGIVGTGTFCGYSFDLFGRQIVISAEGFGQQLIFSPFPLVKRKVFEEIGGYESLAGSKMYFEDSDFGFRLWDAGYQMLSCPDLVVLHKMEPSEVRGTMNADINRLAPEFFKKWKKYLVFAETK